MAKYRRMPTENSCPKADWFKDLELPTGRTFKCIGREVRPLDHVERENDNGQVYNIARETGTNKENVLAIANNIRVMEYYLMLNHHFYLMMMCCKTDLPVLIHFYH